MTGQNVTINDLTIVSAVTASMSFPVMDGAATDTNRATALQVREYVGVISGTGAPTATTYTHPTIYMRVDGTATNNRAYITTSTGGWVAFITAS